MSDYARLQEENLALKAELEAKPPGVKATDDSPLRAENDRLRAALQDIVDGHDTKDDMKSSAAAALKAKK